MLDNLMNPDLSGVSGYIRYSYDSSMEVFPHFLLALGFILLVGGLLVIISKYLNGSASGRYRELLSDMYVVGKIKQIASEDKVDLTDELKKFGSIMKKSNVNLRTIDDVIEMELKEKIQERSNDVKPSKK